MHDHLLAFPIIGWEITALPSEEVVCVRLPYLPLEHESLAEAHSGKAHAMSIEQAREFRDALTRSIQRIDAPPESQLTGKSARHREQMQQRRNAERRKRDRRQQVSR